MNAWTFSIGVLLLTAGCGAAQACVCGAPDQPGNESADQWIEEQTAGAAHVFLARVVEVIRTNKKPDLDQRAKVEALEHLKGDAALETLSVSLCQNFALQKGDVRVFFVSAEGMILPCSDYRKFIRDEVLLRKLRLMQQK